MEDVEKEIESFGIKLYYQDLEDNEISKLRELRSKYNNLVREIQQRIDNRVMELYEVSRSLNKSK